MDKKKVLITDGVHQVMFDGLKNLGFETEYLPNISLEEVHEKAHLYQGLVINSKIIVDKHLIDKMKDMIFIARLGSGMEIIDQEYAASNNIKIINSPEGNCNAVAEHALGMLLALANNLHRADKEVRKKEWNREKNRGFELQGKTIGIIGFGHTGSTFSKKLESLSIDILAHDKYKYIYEDGFSDAQAVELSEIQQRADIISFHLPLNDETQYYCDKEFINKCKKGVIIINTSRGGIVNTKDLLEALQSGQVGGACLDVFENEKPHTFTSEEDYLYQQLYQMDNVILSPHVAGWTQESKKKLSEIIINKLSEQLGMQDIG